MASEGTVGANNSGNKALNEMEICENGTDVLTTIETNSSNATVTDGSKAGDGSEESESNPSQSGCVSPNEDQVNGAVSKKNRRVYFKEDRLVSGFMEPPNPWNEASGCSTEELVCAYQIACEKHGIKPIPTLLHQLKGITDFCDRNETLTLKAERIDYKHCDTFEEVLRRVQFRTFDLEATHLEEEGAIALFDMIEYYESCTRLNLSFNKNIGVRGWQACARMLKKTPCIEQLDARNTGLTEQVMPMLGRALRLGSQLTVLHLESAILSGRPLMILVTAIKMNEILRELYLAENKLMPSDGIQLGNMLKFNHKLALLDLRNNHLQDVGTSHLCDGLYEQSLGCGLNTLVLWNNQITYQSMPSLARALTSTKCLETLNLGHNNVTNEGIHRIKDGLLHNKSLLRIGLQAAKVTCEGAVALAEFIADSTRLLRIDLRENDIKTGGLMALSLSLKVSETVTRIDLDKEPKRESGMKDYADQQRRLLQDISNLMLRNRDLLRQREEEERQRQQLQEEALRFAAQNETSETENEAELPQNAGPIDQEEAVSESKAEAEKSEIVESESALAQGEATANAMEGGDSPVMQGDTDIFQNVVKSENEATAEGDTVEIPQVVALDDVVPQLCVPPATEEKASDLQTTQDTNSDKELAKEAETSAEDALVESVLKEVNKMDNEKEESIEGEIDVLKNSVGSQESPEKDRNGFGPERLLGAGRKGEGFHLDLPLTSKVSTLESPAFIPASALPMVTPPSEEEMAALTAASCLSVTSPEYNPMEFPPSPMVGTARPISGSNDSQLLSPEKQGGNRTASSSEKDLSPNTRRKFLVSLVVESASPVSKTTESSAAKHSTDSDVTVDDNDVTAVASSYSAFQSSSDVDPASKNDGTQGQSAVAKDTDVLPSKEPVSLPEHHVATRDLNENPTQRVSTTTQETSQQKQQAGCQGDASSNSSDTLDNSNSAKRSLSSPVTNSSSIPNPTTISTSISSETDNKTTKEGEENKTTTTPRNSGHVFPAAHARSSSDNNHNMAEGGDGSPDFHTSLSLNGMRVELAHVIDSLEKSGGGVKGSSGVMMSSPAVRADTGTAAPDNAGHMESGRDSPDDFEKDLDELLANLPVSPVALQNKTTGDDASLPVEALKQPSS